MPSPLDYLPAPLTTCFSIISRHFEAIMIFRTLIAYTNNVALGGLAWKEMNFSKCRVQTLKQDLRRLFGLLSAGWFLVWCLSALAHFKPGWSLESVRSGARFWRVLEGSNQLSQSPWSLKEGQEQLCVLGLCFSWGYMQAVWPWTSSLILYFLIFLGWSK